jgi:hypothetical protein
MNQPDVVKRITIGSIRLETAVFKMGGWRLVYDSDIQHERRDRLVLVDSCPKLVESRRPKLGHLRTKIYIPTSAIRSCANIVELVFGSLADGTREIRTLLSVCERSLLFV